MTFGSTFTGIAGFDKGLEGAGMLCVWQVENDRDCNRVLRRHYPDVPRFGDVKDFDGTSIAVRPDWICGGFPCQDLSVAGRRAGLAGERSGLFHEFMRVVAAFRPNGVLIENVPGLYSSWSGDTPSSLGVDPGRGRTMDLVETSDLSTVLDALSQFGYGWAYRCCDAQYFGLAQRRERVFIVGCLGDVRRAAQILFESDSLPWNPAPRRETGARVAATITSGVATGSGVNKPGRRREDDVNIIARSITTREGQRMGCDQDTFVVGAIQSHSREHGHAMTTQQAAESGHLIAHALSSEGADASEDGTGRGTPIIAIHEKADRNWCNGKGWNEEGIGYTLEARHHAHAVAYQPFVFDERNVTSNVNRSNPKPGDPCHTLHSDAPRLVAGFKRGQGAGARSDGYQPEQSPTLTSSDSGTQQSPGVQIGMAVRRLTPRECERLQGFPDDWTRYDDQGKEISDSARYRMLGNAVAVPVAQWIGQRLMQCTPTP